ncbi:MAG TPA: hypothetical protein PKV33_02120 [Methanothrix sp.]|nr:hypothetical protein [Methanothrix sp.]
MDSQKIGHEFADQLFRRYEKEADSGGLCKVYLKAIRKFRQMKSMKPSIKKIDLTGNIFAIHPNHIRTEKAWIQKIFMHDVPQAPLKFELQGFDYQTLREDILKAGPVLGRYHATYMIIPRIGYNF